MDEQKNKHPYPTRSGRSRDMDTLTDTESSVKTDSTRSQRSDTFVMSFTPEILRTILELQAKEAE